MCTFRVHTCVKGISCSTRRYRNYIYIVYTHVCVVVLYMAARSTVLCYILLLLSSIIFNNSMGIVTSNPALACPGESITVSCDLSVPNPGDSFLSLVTNFIVGNSVPLSDIIVNGVDSQGGVDLSKLTADSPISKTANVLGTITLLSYTLADNGLRLGCSNDYIVNGDSTDRITLTETINIQQAAPPSPPVSLTANLDSTTCSGNVELSWIPGATDSSIQMYQLFINGDYFHSTPNSSYSYYTTLEIDTEYEYSVIAMNCAGNSSFNTISIGVPSSPVLRVFSYTCGFDVSWDTPSTDSPIRTYSVYRNDIFLAKSTRTVYVEDTSSLAANTLYTYSVTAISCVGSSVPGVKLFVLMDVPNTVDLNYQKYQIQIYL
ncbi:Chitin-binding protein [Oopsacas minuta]|uniref:Chitin-binding protein n=1 Tax=Oopsacas minuta TaxID=111878 RepID=A0AAV7JCH8_9METZ|nr:Chitin-binding protein [Oopsacas minuta]